MRQPVQSPAPSTSISPTPAHLSTCRSLPPPLAFPSPPSHPSLLPPASIPFLCVTRHLPAPHFVSRPSSSPPPRVTAPFASLTRHPLPVPKVPRSCFAPEVCTFFGCTDRQSTRPVVSQVFGLLPRPPSSASSLSPLFFTLLPASWLLIAPSPISSANTTDTGLERESPSFLTCIADKSSPFPIRPRLSKLKLDSSPFQSHSSASSIFTAPRHRLVASAPQSS